MIKKNALRSELSRRWLILFTLWLPAASFLIYISQKRLIARDEGYYLYAAKLVADGLTPYVDFFYPQMPLLPYIFGAAISLFGESWEIARAVSGCSTALLLLLLLKQNQQRSLFFSIILILLFCCSNFILPWYTTVQSYSLSALLTFSAIPFIRRYEAGAADRPCFKLLAFAGFLLGSAVAVRLTMLAIIPAVFAYWVICRRKNLLKKSAYLLVGCILAGLPVLILALNNWDSFLYNNLGYHITRSPQGAEANSAHLMQVLKVLFGFSESVKFTAPQMPFLLWTFIFGLFWSAYKRNFTLEQFIVLALFFTHILPKPTYVHYFALLAPFLMLGLAKQLEALYRTRKRLGLLAASILVPVYLNGSLLDIRAYTETGRGVIGIMNQANANKWNLRQLQEIRSFLAALPPQQAYAAWPGFLVGSSMKALPGTENHFAIYAASKLPAEKNEAYHLVGLRELQDLIAARRIPLVLLLNSHSSKGMQNLLIRHDYQMLKVIGPAIIFRTEVNN